MLAFWEDRVVSRFGSLYGKRSLHRHVDLTAVLVVASLHRYFQFCSILFASSNCFVSFRSVDLRSRYSFHLSRFHHACHVFITHSSHQCRYSQLRDRATFDRLFHCRLVNYPHRLSSMPSMSTQRRLLVMICLLLVYCLLINDAR